MFGIRAIVGISVLAAAQWALVLNVAADAPHCLTLVPGAIPSSLHLGSTPHGVEARTVSCAGILLVTESGQRAPAVSLEQRSRLDAEIARLPADLRSRFDARYRDWRRTWDRPDILARSNPKVVRNNNEFRALATLGPRILPLVVDRLLQPDEFFALQLYDVLQDRPELREDGHRDLGEQRRALATARRWLSR